MTNNPFLSVIIPVYNGGDIFKCVLKAFQQSSFTDYELIVVDDGSTDGSYHLAHQITRILPLQTAGRQGPAAARNLGARVAKGQYLYFIDADCEIHPDTLSQIAQIFRADPDLDALFGSYDDSPGPTHFIAQYKNLFHHYVHQTGHSEASTFWTGCGAIKRTRFLALGGFDTERYQRPSIEDIELGYRLKQAGGRIRLAKQVQVKHHKAWTLFSLLKTDILDRGIPWTRLLLEYKAFTPDLNLQTHNRVSVIAVYLLLLALILFQGQAFLIIGGLMALLGWLNWSLYHFFYRKRGLWFTLRVIPFHWLYYFYNGLSFGCGLILEGQRRLRSKSFRYLSNE